MLPELKQKHWLKKNVMEIFRGQKKRIHSRKNRRELLRRLQGLNGWEILERENEFRSRGFLGSKDNSGMPDKLLIFSTSPATLHCVDLSRCLEYWGLSVTQAYMR